MRCSSSIRPLARSRGNQLEILFLAFPQIKKI